MGFFVQTSALGSDSRLKARRQNNHSFSKPTQVEKAAFTDQYKHLISDIHHRAEVRYIALTCVQKQWLHLQLIIWW